MIRRAAPADIHQLLVIGRQFHAESGYADFGLAFDALALRETLEATIDPENPDAATFVAERDGAIVGVACVLKTRAFMSRSSIAAELFWWVHPDCRGSSTSIRLMQSLEQWARTSDCALMTMINLARLNESPAAEIYQRLGYSLAENSWIKRL